MGNQTVSETASILIKAHELMKEHGTRPYWPLKPFRKGENVPDDLAPDVVAHLIPCESLDRDIPFIIDSNGLPSRGTLMYQDTTWKQFQMSSGLPGTPTDTIDAIQMTLWAVEHGYLNHWSCARILKIVQL